MTYRLVSYYNLYLNYPNQLQVNSQQNDEQKVHFHK